MTSENAFDGSPPIAVAQIIIAPIPFFPPLPLLPLCVDACLHTSLWSTVSCLLGDVLHRPPLFGLFCQATVNAGDEDASREALEALNVVAVKLPQLLTEGKGLDVAGKAMLSLAASPALEVIIGLIMR